MNEAEKKALLERLRTPEGQALVAQLNAEKPLAVLGGERLVALAASPEGQAFYRRNQAAINEYLPRVLAALGGAALLGLALKGRRE
ncbi:MAG: hypothetical protein Q8R28_16415 [Dehalococcoidia bacterium]|nr:hypothetical protein [Dehalococcoidia bacterium]